MSEKKSKKINRFQQRNMEIFNLVKFVMRCVDWIDFLFYIFYEAFNWKSNGIYYADLFWFFFFSFSYFFSSFSFISFSIGVAVFFSLSKFGLQFTGMHSNCVFTRKNKMYWCVVAQRIFPQDKNCFTYTIRIELMIFREGFIRSFNCSGCIFFFSTQSKLATVNGERKYAKNGEKN